MTSSPQRLRIRSLSNSHGSGDPQPATKAAEAPARTSSRQAAIPHARSLSNTNYARPLPPTNDDSYDDFRAIAREQIDCETLRELVQFFRNTSPPSSPHDPMGPSYSSRSGSKNHGRWSMRSNKSEKDKSHRHVSLPLRDASTRKTTAAGTSYRAIAIPPALGVTRRASLQSSLSVHFPRQSLPPSRLAEADWPTRFSSRPGTVKTPDAQLRSETPTSNPQSPPSNRSSQNADLAALVSRSPLERDRGSFSLSIKVTTKEQGVRSFMRHVDEWLDEQSPDSDFQIRTKQPKRIAAVHYRANSAMANLTVAEESTEEDGVSAQPRTTKHGGRSLSLSANETLHVMNRNPLITPIVDISVSNFPEHGPKRRSDASETLTADISPRSSLRVKNRKTSNHSLSKSSPPETESKPRKKPASIDVKQSLMIPNNPLLPESPGFPMLLAKMTFPSPPDSIRSHSASNSVSIPSPTFRATSPTSSVRPLPGSPPLPNLDQRLMQQTRPPLRHYHTDGGALGVYGPQETSPTFESPVVSSTSKTPDPQDDAPLATTITTPTQPSHFNGPSTTEEASQRFSVHTFDLQAGESPRESNASTVESSAHSVATSGLSRDSMKSDTTVATVVTDATATTTAHGKSDATSPQDKTSGTSSRPISIQSFSSVGTTGTAASLAERRMARRARVREKLQRDIDTTKANKKFMAGVAGADSLDSPILGRHHHNVPGGAYAGPKATAQGPSKLGQDSSFPETAPNPAVKKSGHVARRLSVADITQLIPETVEENTTPVSQEAPRVTNETSASLEPGTQAVGAAGSSSSLSPPSLGISPIMVVANIEAHRPSCTSLRPLSLLTTSGISSRASTIRPETMKTRPLPIRVSTRPPEMTSNVNLSKRSSISYTPTQPMHSSPSASSRMSLPPGADLVEPVLASRAESDKLLARMPPSSGKKKDKETEWVAAHQRQLAREWRLVALKERLRRELAEEMTTEVTSRFIQMTAQQEGDDDEEVDDDSEEERRRKFRTSVYRNSTLRTLNANAPNNSPKNRQRRTTLGSLKSIQDHGEEDEGEQEERTPSEATTGYELELATQNIDVEQRIMSAIIPLLQSMDSTLKELRKERVTRDLSLKFMDSALAMANPMLSGRQGPPPLFRQ